MRRLRQSRFQTDAKAIAFVATYHNYARVYPCVLVPAHRDRAFFIRSPAMRVSRLVAGIGYSSIELSLQIDLI